MFVVLTLMVLAVGACEVTRHASARSWTQSAETTAGKALNITVNDTSGRIDNVEIDPAGVDAFGGVASPPGQPKVLLVPWTGGACDERTQVEIAGATTPALAISITTQVSAGACDAIGVPHVLRITGIAPIPAGGVTLTGP
jgi:hypothetical protein